MLAKLLEKGDIEPVVLQLREGGKWPAITTDSFAAEKKIENQKDLVAFSDRLVQLLREQAEQEPKPDITALEREAGTLFSLSERLWEAGGYRNRVASLIAYKIGVFRCAKIVLLSHGENDGPERPAFLRAVDAKAMLDLFVMMAPEIAPLAKIGLREKTDAASPAGQTWVELLAEISNIPVDNSTLGESHPQVAGLRMDPLGTILNSEHPDTLVFHYGQCHSLDHSTLPALALYLKNGGDIDVLVKESWNATRFKDVMKKDAYRFTNMPVMDGIVSAEQLEGLVDAANTSSDVIKRTFGPEK